MFKKATIIFFVIMSNFSFLYAAIITVDNKYPSVGQYKNLQEAYDAANDGDSIYVYPSKQSYSSLTISKRLTISGSIGVETSTVGSLSLTVGSAGSIIDSLNIGGIYIYSKDNTIRNNANTGDIKIYSENQVIKQNKNCGDIGIYANNQLFMNNVCGKVYIDADNVIIKQNKTSRMTISGGHENNEVLQNEIEYNNSGYSLYINKSNRAIIKNNIIKNTENYSSIYGNVLNIDSLCNISIINNILYDNDNDETINLSSETHAFFVNNIIYSGRVSSLGEYHYNLFCGTDYSPTSNNNIYGNPYFTNGYHLNSRSPAIGAGQNGIDMGIYGGDTPYVDNWADSSSILPIITQLKAEPIVAEGTQGLEIRIKANAGSE